MTTQQFKKFWWITLFIKLAFTAWLPLFSDEAYYWVWSKNLQLSYYDHPPFIAWLFWLGHFLEPLGHAVRWPPVIFGHLAVAIWFFILKDSFSGEKLRIWFLMALIAPISGLGLLIATPDLPLMVFWSSSLLFLKRCLDRGQLADYLGLGASLGLGFCSKYHVVLFLPIIFSWILLSRRWRDFDWTKVPWTILTGLVFCTPVLLWNYQNEWISFKFQLNHGLGGEGANLISAWNYLTVQVALIFPTILFFCLRRNKELKDKNLDWLPYFSFGPILFFLFTSFKGHVEPNWPGIAYPSLVALAIFNARKLRWAKWTLAIWGTLLFVVTSEIALPWLPNGKKMKTYELTRYKPLVKIAESYKPFYASTFQMASQLSYELKTPIYKLHTLSRRDFFDELDGSIPKEKSYFFAAQKWYKLPHWAVENGHKIIKTIPATDRYVLFQVEVP